MILPPDNRIFGKKEIDPNKIVYHSEIFDFKEAAKERMLVHVQNLLLKKEFKYILIHYAG